MPDAAEFILGLQQVIAQYTVVAVLAAAAAGAFSTTTCPCTLPVGLGLIGYIGSSLEGTAKTSVGPGTAGIGLAFFVGLVISLTALGTAAALMGKILAQWASPFAAAMAVLMLGAGLFASFRPRIRRWFGDPVVHRRGGMGGAFVYGLLYSVATITSSGGPLLLVLTVTAAMGRPLLGGSIAFAFALGRGAPFLLLGMFAASAPIVRRLEQLGRPTEMVSGIIMLGLSIYFVWLAATLG